MFSDILVTTLAFSFLFVPVEEIEQMTSLFQQKHDELQSAAARVEELSSQLDALRNTLLEPPIPFHPHNSSYAAELKGLHKDLQVRFQS